MDDPFELDDEAPAGLPDAADPSPYLAALNAAQREAVETTEGPVLVLAGAGTGKTRVLTTRLAHILVLGRARPWQILSVTFTNKAAREMRERVAALLGCTVDGWWLGTFHALAARMLRRHAEVVGLEPNFTILDSDDQLRLIKQLLEARRADAKRSPPRLVLSIIQRWKDRGLSPDQVSDGEGADALDGLALAVYGEYQDRLRTVNAADFGDLLLHCLTLFAADGEALRHYQRQFRYLLVDEYQDTNVAQYLWLRALAQTHHNICCVGDDDQSIYSWRGAEVGNILRFEEDFPGASVIRLECNYRSTPHILAAASALIAHNRSRLGKTLWTHHNEGERVRVRGTWDSEDEARTVCDDMEALRRRGTPLSQMAVLVRAGFQTREFEERLVTIGLPYRIVGGVRFYERQEIRDAIAYLRVVVQPDDDLAFERIVNVPKRGLGTATLRSLHRLARADGTSLAAAARRLLDTDELKPAARRALGSLTGDFARWRELLGAVPHAELASLVLEESGYVEMWQQDRSPDAAGRLDNLKELVTAIADFDSLGGFLEHVSLVMDNDEGADADRVTLMTLHAAKGLEFDVVFLPGWEEGLFPHQRALDEGGEASLEEERRLAYVGLTRARRLAIVSYAARRHAYGFWQASQPSRFVVELPRDNVEPMGPAGLREARRLGAGVATMATDHADGTGPSRRRTPLIDGVPYSVTTRAAPATPFAVGQRVVHKLFGSGEVVGIDGDRLEIAFDTAGRKLIIAGFVEAA
jgi:DNA helicase-2/ATP-dependent DNA helicase PcrA